MAVSGISIIFSRNASATICLQLYCLLNSGHEQLDFRFQSVSNLIRGMVILDESAGGRFELIQEDETLFDHPFQLLNGNPHRKDSQENEIDLILL